MSAKITKRIKETFESIKKLDESGKEYWTSRDLSRAIGYSDYRNFLDVARKGWNACRNSGQNPNDHFVVFTEMISIGKSAERKIENIKMSRLACYLTLQNADSSKTAVAQAQAYFAYQTRRAEIILDKESLSEDEQKRLMLRRELSKHNTHLAGAAKDAGITTGTDYAIFQNHGYQGLYGGLDAKDIHNRKGLKKVRIFLITWAALN